jgi:hypothetical protein
MNPPTRRRTVTDDTDSENDPAAEQLLLTLDRAVRLFDSLLDDGDDPFADEWLAMRHFCQRTCDLIAGCLRPCDALRYYRDRRAHYHG